MSLEKTISEGQRFVSNYVQKRDEANTLLYQALGHATDLLRQAETGKGDWPQIKAFAEDSGINDTVNGTKKHLIVRLIFKDLLAELSHDQVYQYGRVIDEAYKNGKAGKDVPEWIKSQGGINMIRRKAKKSNKNGKGGSKPNTYTLEHLKTYVTDLFEMGEPAPASETAATEEGQIVAQLGRVDENGNIEVCDTVPVNDDETASALLANCYRWQSTQASSEAESDTNEAQHPSSEADSGDHDEAVSVETVAAELEPAE